MRLNLTLDDEHAALLARLAERAHVQPGTLARSLLFTTLDGAAASDEEEQANLIALLDSVPGAFASHQRGLQEVQDGVPGVPLADL
jgi:hypothetical protein